MRSALRPDQAPISLPSYHRALATSLQLDALTLVRRLQLLALCHRAIQLALRRCPLPLPAGPGGAPRIYAEESLLLLAPLRTLWRLSYQELRDWLCAWPVLALACGLPLGSDGRPHAPSQAQQSMRLRAAVAPASDMLVVLLVRPGLGMGLSHARDLILILASAPILAWRRADPERLVATPRTLSPSEARVATGCTPCCVGAPACRCSSASRPPTSMMPPLPARC
jgi:hypothetical protein